MCRVRAQEILQIDAIRVSELAVAESMVTAILHPGWEPELVVVATVRSKSPAKVLTRSREEEVARLGDLAPGHPRRGAAMAAGALAASVEA